MSARTLNLYIARKLTATLALIFIVFGLIVGVADYLDVLRRFADEEVFTAAAGLKLSVMRIPILLDAMLPFIFLFGATIALFDVSRSSELVVARASGISAWGFMRGPATVALVFGAIGTAALNPLAVSLSHRAASLEAKLKGGAPWNEGSWFRQEGPGTQSVVHVGSASSDRRTLFGVTAYIFDMEGNLREKVSASRAEFVSDRWVMQDAKVLSATAPNMSVGVYELHTRLTPAVLQKPFLDPWTIDVWSLPHAIEMARQMGIEANPFRVVFHSLLNRPLMLLAMVMIAATVSLRLTRDGNRGGLILSGTAIGFLLYAANEVVIDLGSNGILHPIFAAWLPPTTALTFAATVLLFQEDG